MVTNVHIGILSYIIKKYFWIDSYFSFKMTDKTVLFIYEIMLNADVCILCN